MSRETGEVHQTAHGGLVRSVLRGAVPAQEWLPVAYVARRVSKVAHGTFFFAIWSEPDQDGVSVLERALKKSGWRGPYQAGTQRYDELFDR